MSAGYAEPPTRLEIAMDEAQEREAEDWYRSTGLPIFAPATPEDNERAPWPDPLAG